MADTPDQEPRIWVSPIAVTPANGDFVYTRLFASPYIPILTTFRSSTQTFETVLGTSVFDIWEISQWSATYEFP